MRKKFMLILTASVKAILVTLLVFTINGALLAHKQTPVAEMATITKASPAARPAAPAEIKVMAYNIAKGFIHEGGLKFAARAVMAQRLTEIAQVIKAADPDIVLLSETILECTLSRGNQVAFLAQVTNLPNWVFGENYNFGLPFLRIIGGNAILSRWPLKPVANFDLAGRQPFYVTKNNRRMLLAALQLSAQEEILIGAVHNDSYNPANNLAQVQQIVAYLAGRPAILGGDFNAQPHEPPIQWLLETKQFTYAADGGLTFSANKPEQTIDLIFAPANWHVVTHQVIQTPASDHLPVVTVFRRP